MRRMALLLVLGCAALAPSMLAGEDIVPAKKDAPAVSPADALKDSVKNADGVVVAKIVRKGETELVRLMRVEEDGTKALVTETLMGPELSGQEIVLLIEPKMIEKDRSYVVFFKHEPGGYPVAIGIKRLDATPENVESAKKEIAAQEKSVSAARVVWMRRTTGRVRIEDARVTELIITANNVIVQNVRAVKDNTVLDTAIGMAPKEAVDALVAKLTAAGAGPDALDAGSVAIEFLDAKGKLQRREYSMPDAAPCAGLLEAMDILVNKYGKRPE